MVEAAGVEAEAEEVVFLVNRNANKKMIILSNVCKSANREGKKQ